ncbi:unnamed protein product [Moneuplotes crassus]|uniref:SWIM-type domain-containing protein n=1 Tax=Euplotes crassus TaxID=5936 RepID=A0AAD1Y475_EUPCR|nr:unnamed protein product [Moneuplotes crassus]
MLKKVLKILGLRKYYENFTTKGYTYKLIETVIQNQNFYMISEICKETSISLTDFAKIIISFDSEGTKQIGEIRENLFNFSKTLETEEASEEESSDEEAPCVLNDLKTFNSQVEIDKLAMIMRSQCKFPTMTDFNIWMKAINKLGYFYQKAIGIDDKSRIQYECDKAPACRSRILLKRKPKDRNAIVMEVEEETEFEYDLELFKSFHSHPPIEQNSKVILPSNIDKPEIRESIKKNNCNLDLTKDVSCDRIFNPKEKQPEEDKQNDDKFCTREEMIAIKTILKNPKMHFLITEMMANSNCLKYIHKKVQRYAERFNLPAIRLPFGAFEMEFHKHYTYHNEPTSFMFTHGPVSSARKPDKTNYLQDVMELDMPKESAYTLSNDDTCKQLRLMFPKSVLLTSSPDQTNLLFLFKPVLPTNVVCIHCGYKLNNPDLSLTIIWTVSSNGHCAILGGVISIGKENDFNWVAKAVKGLGGADWDIVVIGGYSDPAKYFKSYLLSTWHLYLELFNQFKGEKHNSNKIYESFSDLVNLKRKEEFEDSWAEFTKLFIGLEESQAEFLDKLKSQKELWCSCFTDTKQLFMHDSLERNRYLFDIVTKSLHKFKSEKMSQVIQAIRLVKVIPYFCEDDDIDEKISRSHKRAHYNKLKNQLNEEYCEYIVSKVMKAIYECDNYILTYPDSNQKKYQVYDANRNEFTVTYPEGKCCCKVPLTQGIPCSHLIKVILDKSGNTVEILDSFIEDRWRKHDGLTVCIPEKSIEDLLLETAPTIPLQNVGAPTRFSKYVYKKRYRKEKFKKHKSRKFREAPDADITSYSNIFPKKNLEYTNRRRKEMSSIVPEKPGQVIFTSNMFD